MSNEEKNITENEVEDEIIQTTEVDEEEVNIQDMKEKNKSNLIKIVTIILIACIFIIGPMIYVHRYYKKITTTLPQNVYFNDINLYGKNKSEVSKLVTDLDEEITNLVIKFKISHSENDFEYIYTLKELGVSSDKEVILSELYSLIGRGETISEKIKNYKNKSKNSKYNLCYELNEDIFYNEMNRYINVNTTITLNSDEKNIKNSYSLKELGVNSNIDELKDSVVALISEDGKLSKSLIEYKNNKEKNIVFNITYEFNNDIFNENMAVFNEIELKEPVNAEYKYSDSKIVITEGENGETLNFEKLFNEFKSNLINSSKLSNIDLQLAIDVLKPEIRKEDIVDMGMTEVLGEFTTNFNLSNWPRSENIRVATKTINGSIIEPGGVFSLNETTGPRTLAKGYKEAGVYINGRVSTGVGGGLCQVSTTLYNAALYADIEILQRSKHSLTVPYVPLSRDAAVSYGIQDIKIKNNTDKYIYIHCHVYENTLTFELIGTKKDNIDIELETVIHKTIKPDVKEIQDDTLEPGTRKVVQNGYTGYTSSLYKHYYSNGEKIKTIKMSTDTYKTLPVLIKVNKTDEN